MIPPKMAVSANVFKKEKEIMKNKPTPRAIALLPVAVFLVLYLVLGIILEYVLKIKMGELSDDELNNVAGGGCYTKDGRLVVSALHICDDFSGRNGVKRGGEYADCCSCIFCTYEKGLWLCNRKTK